MSVANHNHSLATEVVPGHMLVGGFGVGEGEGFQWQGQQASRSNRNRPVAVAKEQQQASCCSGTCAMIRGRTTASPIR